MNPLRYGGIVQSAEKFADLSQRFISRLPDHPHGYIPSVQAPFAARARGRFQTVEQNKTKSRHALKRGG